MTERRGDTIFALASGRGKAGIAVLRLSGPVAHKIVRDLAGALPPARRAGLRKLRADGQLIDEGLVLIFEPDASFTGEPSAELQVHGSMAVIRRLEDVLAAYPECRMAEPGEFTRRALMSGRMDLTQVEGLADLISAETEAQLRQSQRALSGELGRKVDQWRNELIRATALIEAGIDFVEEDVPGDVAPEVGRILESLRTDWEREAAGSAVTERIRDGFEVVVVGAPNAGKSTLINMLAKREVALTSEHPGTTRDVLEVRVDLGGLPVTFLDTAGVRDAEDEVEVAGIERAKARARAADLRLYLDDSAEAYGLPVNEGDLLLHGKCDLSKGPGLNISGKTGEGVDEMLSAVQGELEKRAAGGGLVTRARHRRALVAAATHVSSALDLVGSDQTELVADELRSARLELDTLVGRVDVEEILGHIFSSFCIGK